MKKLILLIILILSSFSPAFADTDYSANVLARVNQMRMARGLNPFIVDPKLQEEAENISMIRASRGRTGHLPKRENNWKIASHEGVGWYSGVDWEGDRFITCYLYSRLKYAGAGLAVSPDGTFYTLRLR